MFVCSLQKFKLNLANTVISQENSSLLSMNTSDLLDLFQLSDTAGEMIRGSEKVRIIKKISALKLWIQPLLLIDDTAWHTDIWS